MKTRSILLALALCFITAPSFAVSWTDGNGMEWTMGPVKTNRQGAFKTCARLGFRVPQAEMFWEAVDLGLLDPKVNTGFGEASKKVDWIWVSETAGTPSFGMIASRWDDLVGEVVTERHWALCARSATY